MAVKASTENVENVTTDATVPHQVAHHAEKPSEKDVVLEGEIVEPRMSLKDKIKALPKNKKVVTTVATIAVLAAGVFAARKRAASENDIDDENLSS